MLWYLYIALLCCAVLTATVRWKYLPATLKTAFSLLCWALLVELLRNGSDKTIRRFLTHLNFIAELSILFFYFYFLLAKNKRIFLYSGLIFYFVAVMITCHFQPTFFREGNLLDSVYLGICVSVWTTLFFLELIQKPSHYSLKSDGNFWINCGNILFYPATLLIFGLENYVKVITPEVKSSLSYINNSLNLTLYFLYFVAFCLASKKERSHDGNVGST